MRIQPVNFRMNYTIEFCRNIRKHHGYKASWTREIGERVICFKDIRREALDYDTRAVGVYKKVEEPEEKLKLVGHVPMEYSFVLNYFLKADSPNKLIATVEGKKNVKSVGRS